PCRISRRDGRRFWLAESAYSARRPLNNPTAPLQTRKQQIHAATSSAYRAPEKSLHRRGPVRKKMSGPRAGTGHFRFLLPALLARGQAVLCDVQIGQVAVVFVFGQLLLADTHKHELLDSAAILYFGAVEVALRVGRHVMDHVELAGRDPRTSERIQRLEGL